MESQISDLPENDLLIDVHYSSLNFKDAMSASGNKRISQNFPHTPGIDAAGVVVSDKSGTFSPGEEVLVFGYDLGMNTPGDLGQKISMPAKWAHAIDTLGGGVTSVGLAASPEIAMSFIPFITCGISLLGVDSVCIPLEAKNLFGTASQPT